MVALYDLAAAPQGAAFHAGVAELTRLAGRTTMRVSLTEQMTRYDVPGEGSLDLPTFISLPIWFEDGGVEVDVISTPGSGVHGAVDPLAGLAYRVGGDRSRFDAVQVRPLNGTPRNPAGPHARRAAQFLASPGWPLDRLWPQEASSCDPSASVAPWVHLSLHVDGNRLAGSVDGVEVAAVPVVKAAALRGDLGLFVDVGTEAYFSNLQITPA